ncbi:MAG: hypothetical protein DRG83_19910 [Deltaproteobacteria bacterium]|nr:MAG: hypothetical protein DRG83_19910 [Deltaproteobacteria bacterium]
MQVKKIAKWGIVVTVVMLMGIVVFGESTCPSCPQTLDEFMQQLEGKAIKADGTPLKVGFTLPELWSQFIVSFNYAPWLLGQAGAIVTTVNCNNDVSKQINFYEDFASMGVDAILSISVDPNAIAPTVKRIKEQYGIPFVFMNKGVYDENGVSLADYYIGSPDYEMGKLAAEYIVEKAAGRHVKVAEVTGPLYQFTALYRDKGFKDVLAQHPNVELVNVRDCTWLADKAMDAVSDILTAHPDIFAIFSQSDCMLPGVFSAMEQAGRLFPADDPKHIIVVATDGAPNAFQAIRDGYLDMTLQHNPYGMSTIGVKALLWIAHGLPLPEERDTRIAPVPVTKDNVDDPSLWGNYGTPKNEAWPGTLNVWMREIWPGEEDFWTNK